MPPKKTTNKSDVEIARLRHGTIRKAIDSGFGVAKTLFRVGGWVGVSGFMYLTMKEMAGKNTGFSAILNGVLSVGADRWVMGIVIAILGGAYGNERRLRKKIPNNRVQYIRELESRIDPNRTSSRLDESGRPQKEDLDAA